MCTYRLSWRNWSATGSSGLSTNGSGTQTALRRGVKSIVECLVLICRIKFVDDERLTFNIV